jgi:hypothetical protein
MPKQKILVNKFNGMISAIDPSIVGITGATSIENYNVDAGQLKPVEGTTKIGTAVSGQIENLGLNYICGFSTSGTFTENFILFSRNATAIQATLFNASGASPSFSTTAMGFSTTPTYNNNEWQTILYDNKIIASNTSQVFQADVGTNTFYGASNFVPIVGFPTSPVATPIPDYLQFQTFPGFTTSAVTNPFVKGFTLWKQDFTTATTGISTLNKVKESYVPNRLGQPSNCTDNYYLNNNYDVIRVGASGDYFYLKQTTSGEYQGRGQGNFKLTFFADDINSTSIAQTFTNLQYRDRLYFRFIVNRSYSTDWANTIAKTTFDTTKFKFTATDRNGRTVTADTKCQLISDQSFDQYMVCVYWDSKAKFDYSTFDYTQVSKWAIEGYVAFAHAVGSGGVLSYQVLTANYFDFQPVLLGGVNLALQPSDQNGNNYINFGTVRYTPSTGEISAVHNLYTLSGNAIINGAVPGNRFFDLPKQGSWLQVQYPIGGTSSTQTWLVASDGGNPSLWRKIGFATNPGTTTASFSTTFYRFNSTDLLSFPAVIPNRTYVENANCMATFNSWVVYGINRGTDNIRHARIGEPLELASTADRFDDDSRGGDYTLSESYSDVPVAMAGILDTLVIFGNEGVYAQAGVLPSAMSACRKIPNLPGIAGRFAYCKYNDSQLGQGVVYVTKDASMAYFLYVDARNQNIQYRTVEMTESIRDTFKTYLTQTQTDISEIRCVYRQDDDSVMICCGREAWIWKRPDIMTQRRPIVKRRLSDAAMRFSFVSMPVNQAGVVLPIVASSGIGTTQCLFKFDNTNYKDHLTDISSVYQSGVLLSTVNNRIKEMWVERLSPTAPVGIAITSTRQTGIYGITTETSNVAINFKQQGFNHQVQLTQTNASTSGIDSFWLVITAPNADRPYHTNI